MWERTVSGIVSQAGIVERRCHTAREVVLAQVASGELRWMVVRHGQLMTALPLREGIPRGPAGQTGA